MAASHELTKALRVLTATGSDEDKVATVGATTAATAVHYGHAEVL